MISKRKSSKKPSPKGQKQGLKARSRGHVAARMSLIQESGTMAVAARAKQLKVQGKRIIDLSLGEPDFDTPVHIKDMAIESIRQGKIKYTAAPGLEAVRQAIVGKLERENNLSYEPEQIVVSNGSKQSLFNTFLAILDPGDEVIIPVPYWTSYPDMVRLAGGVPVLVPTRDFQLDVEAIAGAVSERTKAVLVNSPVNPSGAFYPESALHELARLCVRKRILIVSDEIYEHMLYPDPETGRAQRHVSIASLDEDVKELTITINGVAKAYAMTGWRIGYAAAPLEIAKALAMVQSQVSGCASAAGQYATIAALNSPQDARDLMRKEFQKRRDAIYPLLKVISGITVAKPQGSFYFFIDLSSVESDDTTACTELLERGLALVPGTAFGMQGFARMTYAAGIDSLRQAVAILERYAKEKQVQSSHVHESHRRLVG